MTRLKIISRLAGSVLFALILAAAPILQAARQAADCAPVKLTCGCSCCGTAAESADDSAMNQGSCGCTVTDTAPATETPLDLQPRPETQTDIDADPDIVQHAFATAPKLGEIAINVTVPKEHSPPLYLLHASYRI